MPPKILQSSADPTRYSLAFQGILTLTIPIALMALKHYGYNFTITESDIAEAAGILSSIVVAFGLLRKLYYRIKNAD